MPTTVFNTFTYLAEDAMIAVFNTYAASELAWFPQLTVSHGQDPNRVKFPMVDVVCTSATEEVFQSGIYRLTIQLRCQVDLDVGNLQQLEELSSICQDVTQLSDLATELSNTGLVTVKLAYVGPQSLVELGDRYAERTFDVELIGYSGGTVISVPTVTVTASGFSGDYATINGVFTSDGYLNVWPYFNGPAPWVLWNTNGNWNLGPSINSPAVLVTATNNLYSQWYQVTPSMMVSGSFS